MSINNSINRWKWIKRGLRKTHWNYTQHLVLPTYFPTSLLSFILPSFPSYFPTSQLPFFIPSNLLSCLLFFLSCLLCHFLPSIPSSFLPSLYPSLPPYHPLSLPQLESIMIDWIFICLVALPWIFNSIDWRNWRTTCRCWSYPNRCRYQHIRPKAKTKFIIDFKWI